MFLIVTKIKTGLYLHIQVFYIDWGDSETLPLTNIHFLKKQFCQLPAFAIKCCLFDVRPNNDVDVAEEETEGGWSKETVRAFINYTGFNKQLIAYVIPNSR